jgi:hypothetical protein
MQVSTDAPSFKNKKAATEFRFMEFSYGKWAIVWCFFGHPALYYDYAAKTPALCHHLGLVNIDNLS